MSRAITPPTGSASLALVPLTTPDATSPNLENDALVDCFHDLGLNGIPGSYTTHRWKTHRSPLMTKTVIFKGARGACKTIAAWSWDAAAGPVFLEEPEESAASVIASSPGPESVSVIHLDCRLTTEPPISNNTPQTQQLQQLLADLVAALPPDLEDPESVHHDEQHQKRPNMRPKTLQERISLRSGRKCMTTRD